jgi:hypothetical protein
MQLTPNGVLAKKMNTTAETFTHDSISSRAAWRIS